MGDIFLRQRYQNCIRIAKAIRDQANKVEFILFTLDCKCGVTSYLIPYIYFLIVFRWTMI